ncbi:MAG: hypothetical protein SynsKO_07280 [Synoicihabitans sp.]
MRLWHNKTVWEKLARQDPYWAVLTDPEKSNNRWNVDEFFATGRTTVNDDMAVIRAALPTLSTGHALDFGCGVGRLTQALGDHFDHVTGVDIAAPMIELANQHNKRPESVKFRLNPASDLALFPDDSFDLVYSVITLQHIPPALIPGYIKEFGRICRPGGAVFFQLPTVAPPKRWRFSWYPPTTWMRMKRFFLKTTTIKAEMSMNALKKTETEAILANSNLNLVQAKPYHAAGHLDSLAYLAQKGQVVIS